MFSEGTERPVTLKELEKPVTELANDIGKTKEPFYFTFDYFICHFTLKANSPSSESLMKILNFKFKI